MYQKSKRAYMCRRPKITYGYNAVIRKVNRNGEIKWERRGIYISKSLIGEYIALKQKEEFLWEIWFSCYPSGILNVATGEIMSQVNR